MKYLVTRAFSLHCHFNIRDQIARVYLIAAQTALTSISLLAQCTVAGVSYKNTKNP